MGDFLSMGVTTKTSFNSVIELFSAPDHVVNAPKWAANHIKRAEVLPDRLADGLGQFIYGQSLEGKEGELTFIYSAVKKTLDEGTHLESDDRRSFFVEGTIEGRSVTLIFNQVSDGVEVSAIGYSGSPILLPNVADLTDLHEKLTMRFARKDIVEKFEQLEAIRNPSDEIINVLEMKDQLIAVYVQYAKFRAGLLGNDTVSAEERLSKLTEHIATNSEIRKAIFELFTFANHSLGMFSHNYDYCVDECRKVGFDDGWNKGMLKAALNECHYAYVVNRNQIKGANDDATSTLKRVASYPFLPSASADIEAMYLF